MSKRRLSSEELSDLLVFLKTAPPRCVVVNDVTDNDPDKFDGMPPLLVWKPYTDVCAMD